jgi:Flp pilus assembly protein TadG
VTPSRRLRGEEGAATTEMVIVTPVLLLMIAALVQFGLWYHGTNLANAAAQEGARAYRLEGGTVSDAQREARNFLNATNNDLLRNIEITDVSRGDNVGITVSADVLSVMPIDLGLQVEGRSAGPRERFRGSDE